MDRSVTDDMDQSRFSALENKITNYCCTLFDDHIFLGDSEQRKKYRDSMMSMLGNKRNQYAYQNLKNQYNAEKAKNDKMSVKLKKNEETILKRNQEITRLQNQVQNLTQQLNERDKYFNQLQLENKQITTNLRLKDQQMNSMRTEIEDLRSTSKRFKEVQEANSSLRSENKQLQTKINQSRSQTQELRKESQDLTRENKSLKDNVEKYKTMYHQEQNKSQTLQARNTELTEYREKYANLLIMYATLEQNYEEIKNENTRLIQKEKARDGSAQQNRSDNRSVKSNGRKEEKGNSNSPNSTVIVNKTADLNVNPQLTTMIISNNSCNNMKSLILKEYKQLVTLKIGNNCCSKATKFEVNGLNKLETIKIGSGSFTTINESSSGKWRSLERNSSYSFRIANCSQLKSIEIEEFSFAEYSGTFDLQNLPQLNSLKIGVLTECSRNFWLSSFVVRSIHLR